MKKLLSLVSAIALALPIFAGTVTFKPGDFSGQGVSGTGGEITATKGGVTFTCNKGYGSGTALRCYQNGVVTITSEAKISTIDFQFESASGKTYDGGLEAQVTVNANEWSNTLASQARFTEVTLTIEGEGVEERVDTLSVTEALARLADNKTGECYVKGKVISLYTSGVEQYGNISYWLADFENAEDTIQAFRMKALDNKPYASAADIEFSEGDDVLVYAAGLALYQGKPELNTGYLVRVLNGKDIIALNWSAPVGTAVHDGENWTLEIQKVNGEKQNMLELVFPSDKADAIGGFHTLASGNLTLAGAKEAISAGSVRLTYKEKASNSNLYDVQVSVTAGDKVYRMEADIDFYAEDKNGDQTHLKGDRPFEPTEDGQEITCAQAKEYALSLASGATSEKTVVVTGYVTDLFADGQSFWMDDKEGTVKTLQAYKFKSLTPEGKALANGAKVKVSGYVTNYNGTAEIKDGAVEILEGGEEVRVIEVTVAEAIAVAKELEPGKTSKDTYAITGYISGIAYAYDASYGNISFWMSDIEGDGAQEFQAYRAKCDASIADKLVEGAKVIVTDKIKHFHQDQDGDKPERTIYETVGGGTVVLFGTPVENVFNNAPAVKFIENGQIFILHNGVLYNLQGQIAQ